VSILAAPRAAAGGPPRVVNSSGSKTNSLVPSCHALLSSSATRAAAAQPQALLREGPLTGPYNRKEIDDRLGEGALVGKSDGQVLGDACEWARFAAIGRIADPVGSQAG
jgi:hypothetical protein